MTFCAAENTCDCYGKSLHLMAESDYVHAKVKVIDRVRFKYCYRTYEKEAVMVLFGYKE
ncbi:hypothetical protein [Colwellia sp. 12G3]|uniref:hypothetical protein n=1 Tax=Colwellia sp. 12G3 TaxID=2058299 RepID=UPI0012FF417F|nr:hypothetical protein [Colwellia sp. 12G3]